MVTHTILLKCGVAGLFLVLVPFGDCAIVKSSLPVTDLNIGMFSCCEFLVFCFDTYESWMNMLVRYGGAHPVIHLIEVILSR